MLACFFRGIHHMQSFWKRLSGPARHGPRALAGSVAAALAVAALPCALAAQADSVVVIPGARYVAEGAAERLLGSGYRAAWTTPVRVPVLDLAQFAGGLTPLRATGSMQTPGLRFRGGDGREYNFRSVDKEVTPALPEFARETLVDRIFQDMTSAQLPAAPVVAAVLLDAAGVLHPGPRLVVLPDDPRLGEFRPEFAGRLGTLEVHADEGPGGEPFFAGAPEVRDTEEVLASVRADPSQSIDARAFLRARMVDLLIGDWDRHPGQWRWARLPRGNGDAWVPVPEDRDFAFVDHDGLLPGIARELALPRLVRFQEQFAPPLAMMANSLELNQRLLGSLSRADWDSVAADVQARISDDVILRAVAALPPEQRRVVGADLARVLRARRDALHAAAAAHYGLLARAVEIHGTDTADRAVLTHEVDGSLLLRLTIAANSRTVMRRLDPAETDEVRLYLYGGADQVEVGGQGGPIAVRVIGGSGDDVLTNLGSGTAVLYDHEGVNRIDPPGRARLVGRLPVAPEDRPVDDVPLPEGVTIDWGRSSSLFAPTVEWESNAELVVGGGPSWTRYGFRYDPFASKIALRGLYAPLHGRAALELLARFRREGAPGELALRAAASGLEATRFSGYGNDSPLPDKRESRVWHRRLVAEATWQRPLSRAVALSAGGRLRHTDPAVEAKTAGWWASLFGAEPLAEAGAVGELTVDTRDSRHFPRRGVEIEMLGSLNTVLSGGAQPFGRFQASSAAYFALPGAVIAARAGGAAVGGDFPFYHAAFLGGSSTLRGFRTQRLAGDASLYGGVDLRVPLAELNLLVRGTLGASLLADAGRVFYRGESPGGWHTAAGASLWFTTPPGTLSVTFARGEENRLSARFGLPF